MKFYIPLALLVLSGLQLLNAQVVTDQREQYTRADTLRGSLRPERSYDVLKYHLDIKVNPEERFISGSNTISFKAQNDLPVMQVDLFQNMHVDSILFRGRKLDYRREHHAVFIKMDPAVRQGVKDSIRFFYSGHPVVAENAPWDGGFVFEKDQQGNPWVGVAVQGTGASLWYPNKDHQSDEPEEALIEVAVPDGLMNVSNGRFVGKEDLDNGYTRWSWKVSNPINNYNIIVNIGNYVHFDDQYGNLDLDYYVLPYHLEKAKEQFKEVKKMMDCFYERMGPYPFEEDGFKLVETPYLGMEHQSAVAYGNKYRNGYLGRDLSGTGIGLKWDFIIIHESGHEWYGNSITAADIADMWLHEGFTSYTEAIYVECRWGKKAALRYLQGIRKNISNDQPIIGDYGVNSEGSGDMYYKGSNLLNMIRSIYDNDSLWWKTFKDYTATYRHEIIDTETAEEFFDAPTPTDLDPVFDQYLRKASLPILQLKKDMNSIYYRWNADVPGFRMPVDVLVKGKETRLNPDDQWKKLPQNNLDLDDVNVVVPEFYVKVEKISAGSKT